MIEEAEKGIALRAEKGHIQAQKERKFLPDRRSTTVARAMA